MTKARKIIIKDILYYWTVTPDTNKTNVNNVKVWQDGTGKIIYEGTVETSDRVTPKHIIDIIVTNT